MPSLAKGTHAFRPSQQTTGVAGPPQASGSMGPPVTQRAMHDSDDDIPPDSTPPRPPSASLPSSITSSQKRKRVAFDSVSESFASTSFGSGSKDKKQRVSGGAAVLSGIKESIDTWTSTMRTGMPTASVRAADRAAAYRVQAMDKVQREEEALGGGRVIALIDLFRSDSSAAEAYMAIVSPIILQKWLNKQMMLLGFPNYVPGEKDVLEEE